LLELTSELLTHLESGGTLVVPSRQRATAVRLAHSSAMLAAGLKVWNSPDVLPWNGWLERELDAARARFESLPRRLSSAEEWLLWRDVVREACTEFGVLMPDALIAAVRRAVGRMDDFGLQLPAATSAETAVLLNARAAFRRRCQELGAIGATSWQDCVEYLRPTQRVLLAGFPTLGAARRRWLQQHGVRVVGAVESADSRAASVAAFEEPSAEARAAAQWCWTRLERDPRARLLLVVPRLAQQRHLYERALSQRLDFAALLSTGISAGSSLFAIEGGRPLSSYALVAAAIDLIGLLAGPVSFTQFGALLRSPYFSALEREGALRLELWLREHNIAELSVRQLPALIGALNLPHEAAAAAPLQRLSAALTSVPGTASADDWAQALAALLQRCGWPGALTLGSDEHQVRVRFDELLGEFAGMGSLPGRLRAAEAATLMSELAQRLTFEPATDDVPVTVTANLDDPIAHYDGIWVAGLSADLWPAPAQPDPLLPPLAQQQSGLPEASAAGQLSLAGQRLQQWRARAGECVFSWSHSDAGVPNDPSPLLSASSPTALPDDTFDLPQWIAAQAPPMEAWVDSRGPPVSPSLPLARGVRILELQSLCPFRGFAELRLRACRLPEPAPGIDRSRRGQLLHAALEHFWRQTRDSTALLSLDPERTRERVRQCVAQAAAAQNARQPGGFPAELLTRECARAARLIEHLLEWERTREAFQVQSPESRLAFAVGGTTLALRPDRVDRLADGALAVIDYKSGAARPFDAFADRLAQPQLPAYALASGAGVSAVLMLHLQSHGLGIRGLADRSGRLPKLKPPPEGAPAWPELMRRWAGQLELLMAEYLSGYAAVQPLKDACAHCHLRMLCRVDPQLLEAAELAAESVSESVEP
jgi:probable DNA repair protein